MTTTWLDVPPQEYLAPVLRRNRLGHEVASYIRDAIFSGQLKPGEKLPLRLIGDFLSVSTTPVRDGLLILQAEGLVVADNHRGFRAAGLTKQDILDRFDLHAIIAGKLAARAVPQVSAEFIAHLRQLNASISENVQLGRNDIVEQINYDFHRVINYQAPDGNSLRSFLQQTARCIPRRYFGSISGWLGVVEQDHSGIIEAFDKRDENMVRHRVETHIRVAGELLAQHLESVGTFRSTLRPE
ncbi:MAG: GntR family transcriptional regulator [Acidimicrobiales bacterium]